MKWCIAIMLGLFCALSATARAQEVTAPVLADVVQDLTLTSTGQTSFGTIGNAAHTERIDPAAPASGQQTAQITLTTGAGNIAITCSSEVTLTEPVNSTVMTFTPEISVNFTQPDQASSQPGGCFGGAAPGGTIWIWLGGSLVVAANQTAGSYSGVYTFSAVYQ